MVSISSFQPILPESTEIELEITIPPDTWYPAINPYQQLLNKIACK